MAYAAVSGTPARTSLLAAIAAELRLDEREVEAECRALLVALRWPDGVACPRCGAQRPSPIPRRAKWSCNACRYHFSVRSGTLLHDSHLPLWKWLVAVQVAVGSSHLLVAEELRELLGGSYKSWWYAAHRIRRCLRDARPAVGAPPAVAGAIAAVLAERASLRADGAAFAPYRSSHPRYRGLYWSEAAWRLRSGRDRNAWSAIVRGLLDGEPLPYAELVG
jgi:transposase-like protein